MSNELPIERPHWNGPALFAARVMMSAVAIVAAPLAVWLWGIHRVSPEWSLASTLAVVASAWIVATLFLLAIRPLALKAGIALATWAVFASIFFAQAGQRSVCGAHAIKRDSELRALIQAGLNERASTGEIPQSFAVLAAENGYWNAWSPRACRCDGLADLAVGRYTLKDFEAGRVSLDDLRAEAGQNPPGEFERMGKVTIWRNPNAWNHGLLVAWRTPDDPRWDWFSVGRADMSVRCFDDMSDEDVAVEIDRAAKVGVTYPAELLDLIHNRKRD